MIHKVTMVKGGIFETFTKRKKEKLRGDTFLVQLDSITANRYRKDAKTKGIDANKYLAQILTINKK